MHFWIDKRSQPCIGRSFRPCIGRNRVFAGSYLGFTHQRRIRNKSMITGCSNVDPRPQTYHQQTNHAQPSLSQQQPQAAAQSVTQQSTHHHQHHHHHRHHSQNKTHHHHHHHHRSSQLPIGNNEITTQAFYYEQSLSVPPNTGSSRSSSASPVMQSAVQTEMNPLIQSLIQSQETNNCNSNYSMNQIYRAGHASIDIMDDVSSPPTSLITMLQQQSHAQQPSQHDNQPSSIGGINNNNSNSNATQANQQLNSISNSEMHANGVSNESQLLPTHIKCGMWASLALVSVFVAGAKFYFDHQGTGLEMLMFCAFVATFFIFACTILLCHRSKNMQNHQNVTTDADMDGGIYFNQSNQSNSNSNNSSSFQQVHQQSQIVNSSIGPPPPYHIAILLPENTVKHSANIDVDDTPPPSYDKIII